MYSHNYVQAYALEKGGKSEIVKACGMAPPSSKMKFSKWQHAGSRPVIFK